MSDDSLICTVEDGHARIVLNRPQAHNALDGALIEALSETLSRLEVREDVRVVSLRGEGPSFCAGADLKFFLEVLDDAPRLHGFIRKVQDAFTRLEQFPKPVLAVVHGFVLAGGLEMSLACDLVLAAEDAALGDQHINFGLLPGGGASQRLPRVVGMRKAKEMMMMGSRVSGSEAERLGLVNKAVPAARLEAEAGEWVANLLEKTPTGLRYMKEMLHGSDGASLKTGLALEESVFLNYARLDDLREGLKAFQEKRKPNFSTP